MKEERLNLMCMLIIFGIGMFGVFSLPPLGFAAPIADYGDNPDSYHTLWASGGPYHFCGQYEWLGHVYPSNTDLEIDGQPTPGSNGDDLNGATPDDEDGITFLGTVDPIIDPSRYWGGYYGGVDVLLSVSQWNSGRYGTNNLLYIDGWFDWNHDGDYDDSEIMQEEGPNKGKLWNEHVVSITENPAVWGTNSTTVSPTFLIGEGPVGEIHSRWRLNYDEGVNCPYSCPKTFGEVEDYGPVPDKDQATVPEPCTMLLMGSGLAGLARFARRKKRSCE